MLTAPIIAISSPPGRSARGILRLSADNLSAVLPALLDPPPRPRELCVCRFRTFDLPCLALYHPAPHSYTGQDTLEIQLPGNPALLDRALHAVLDLLRGTTDGVPRFVPRSGQAVPAHDADPARLAEPGEFTRRAYLAGRIDLTRAEGVAATISAETDAQLHAARLLRTGRLGAWAVDLVDRLGQLLALVEVGIDFVDQDDVVAITPGDLDHGLAHVEQQLQNLMQRSRSWSSLEALPWVVLAGPPNAGKSTLFNTLLGHERAVTCDIAGTTRDVLTEPLRITTEHGDAAEVTLVDVAGIDTPRGMIDTSMQHAARAALDRADLVLWVEPTRASGGLPAGALAQCDGSPRNEGQHPGGQAASGAPDNIAAPILRVQSKSDLHTDTTADTSDTIHLSAVTGRGLDTLRRRIAEALADRAVSVSSQMLALTARHHDQLTACLADVAAARAMLTDQRDADTLADMELIADRMRAALDHLASVGGQLTPDDVIGKVFATFCVGK